VFYSDGLLLHPVFLVLLDPNHKTKQKCGHLHISFKEICISHAKNTKKTSQNGDEIHKDDPFKVKAAQAHFPSLLALYSEGPVWGLTWA
jgi:hypothetical protein